MPKHQPSSAVVAPGGSPPNPDGSAAQQCAVEEKTAPLDTEFLQSQDPAHAESPVVPVPPVVPAEAGTHDAESIENLLLGALNSASGMGHKETAIRLADVARTFPTFATASLDALRIVIITYLARHPDETNTEKSIGIALALLQDGGAYSETT